MMIYASGLRGSNHLQDQRSNLTASRFANSKTRKKNYTRGAKAKQIQKLHIVIMIIGKLYLIYS